MFVTIFLSSFWGQILNERTTGLRRRKEWGLLILTEPPGPRWLHDPPPPFVTNFICVFLANLPQFDEQDCGLLVRLFCKSADTSWALKSPTSSCRVRFWPQIAVLFCPYFGTVLRSLSVCSCPDSWSHCFFLPSATVFPPDAEFIPCEPRILIKFEIKSFRKSESGADRRTWTRRKIFLSLPREKFSHSLQVNPLFYPRFRALLFLELSDRPIPFLQIPGVTQVCRCLCHIIQTSLVVMYQSDIASQFFR